MVRPVDKTVLGSCAAGIRNSLEHYLSPYSHQFWVCILENPEKGTSGKSCRSLCPESDFQSDIYSDPVRTEKQFFGSCGYFGRGDNSGMGDENSLQAL